MLNVYEQVDRNKRRSTLIVIGFALFVAAAVYFIGRAFGYGPSFIGWALIISGFTSFIGYWYSDQIILAVSQARPANKQQDFKFFTAVELKTRLPTPLPADGMPTTRLLPPPPACSTNLTGRKLKE
jgi:hypothetical protein